MNMKVFLVLMLIGTVIEVVYSFNESGWSLHTLLLIAILPLQLFVVFYNFKLKGEEEKADKQNPFRAEK